MDDAAPNDWRLEAPYAARAPGGIRHEARR